MLLLLYQPFCHSLEILSTMRTVSPTNSSSSASPLTPAQGLVPSRCPTPHLFNKYTSMPSSCSVQAPLQRLEIEQQTSQLCVVCSRYLQYTDEMGKLRHREREELAQDSQMRRGSGRIQTRFSRFKPTNVLNQGSENYGLRPTTGFYE